jgi:hypothetical protein
MAQMPGHEMAMMHSTDGATHTGHELPLDHAEACGYCVLLAHVPGCFSRWRCSSPCSCGAFACRLLARY